MVLLLRLLLGGYQLGPLCPAVEPLRHLVLAASLLILLHVDHFSVLEEAIIIVLIDP